MQIQIKGKKYKLIFKKLIDAHGICDREKRIIYIDNSRQTPQTLVRWTLCHELVHAYLNEMHITDIMSNDLEEILAETIAEMIDEHIELIAGVHGSN